MWHMLKTLKQWNDFLTQWQNTKPCRRVSITVQHRIARKRHALKKKKKGPKKDLKRSKTSDFPHAWKNDCSLCSETEFPSKTLWKLNRIDSHQIDYVSPFVLSRGCLRLCHGNAGLFTLGPIHTYLPFSWPNNKGCTGSNVFPLTLSGKSCLCFRMYIQTIIKTSI